MNSHGTIRLNGNQQTFTRTYAIDKIKFKVCCTCTTCSFVRHHMRVFDAANLFLDNFPYTCYLNKYGFCTIYQAEKNVSTLKDGRHNYQTKVWE